VTETPSQSITKPRIVTITDTRGRKIEVRKLKTLDKMRLYELVGSSNAENSQYLGFAALAYSVVSIDGNPIGRPATKLALETTVQELDDDGFDAVGKAIEENFFEAPDRDEKTELKNG
jgi:hypothetical protein